MIRISGLAFMAAFRSHWDAAAALLAKSRPLSAVTTACMVVATLNTANPAPMPIRAVAMGSLFALTHSPNPAMVDASDVMTPRAVLNASPNILPAPLAPPMASLTGNRAPMRSPMARPSLPAASHTVLRAFPAAWMLAVSRNAWMNSPALRFTVSKVLMAESRRSSSHATIGLSSSMLNASRSSVVKLPLATSSVTPLRALVARALNDDILSAAALMARVTAGLNVSKASVRPPTTAASRLPNAPSMVLVEVAASLATSVMPMSLRALLNSSAVIWPLLMASRKLPV